MTDMDLQRSLSVLQDLHEEQYIGDDSLYTPYDYCFDPNNNHHQSYTEYYLEEPPMRQTYNYMLSGSDYEQQQLQRSHEVEDSRDSDNNSVVFDENDLAAIEMYELEHSNTPSPIYRHNNQYGHYPYQQVERSQQSSNNLPAFETLFNGRRHTNNVNRLYPIQMSDSEDDEESNSICRKGKRGAKNVLLWKFLLEELKIGKHVEWTDIAQGTFRFVDTSEISRLWGQKKRKDDMNFEKLSRGIRHYYKSGFMSRQEGTRLIYKFNWSKVPKKYRQFDTRRGVPIRQMPY